VTEKRHASEDAAALFEKQKLEEDLAQKKKEEFEKKRQDKLLDARERFLKRKNDQK